MCEGARSCLKEIALRRSSVVLILVIVTMVSFMFGISTHRARAVAGKPLRWMLNGPGVAAIAADADTSRLLDETRPFIMRGRFLPDTIPPSWNAVSFASFANFAAIQGALQEGKLDPTVNGVMYDYERWSFTPVEEQRNPAGYLKQAADLVHARSLLFLTAPAVNLVAVMAPDDGRRRYDAYVRLGIAADAARYADVIDIQAQGSERNTELYASFVRQAAAQARKANPNVVVLAGISTQPSGQNVTADDILRAIAATRDTVDGYWFNIPQPSEYCPRCTEFRPDIAIDVMRRLAAQ
ncbi:MAG TPA: hypothetical protein VJY39_02045 [Acidisphaera sp.]|nr:hypothetical protein [Acidisphaera sp.]